MFFKQLQNSFCAKRNGLQPLHCHFEADSMFHSSYRLRCVGHIEPFQLKFTEGLGIYLVTLSALFRSDRM